MSIRPSNNLSSAFSSPAATNDDSDDAEEYTGKRHDNGGYNACSSDVLTLWGQINIVVLRDRVTVVAVVQVSRDAVGALNLISVTKGVSGNVQGPASTTFQLS